MIASTCDRWRDRVDSRRPAGEFFDPRGHEVAAIPDDTTARAFVVAHHYAASYPAARRRFGLYAGADLVGVAVFSVPARPEVLLPLPCAPDEAADLGRFVLLDGVKGNGESWFLARCLRELAREGWAGVVSFADPWPRTRADGTPVFPGHVGTIYQASNAVFVGQGRTDTVRLLPDGTALASRAVAKVRKRDVGWRYVVAKLVAAGASEPEPDADLRAWLRKELPRVTRTVRAAGKLKYVIGFGRVRRHLPPSLPYVKIDALRGVA